MQLFIGGAFSGKRNVVRNRHPGKLTWLSSYDGRAVTEWKSCWEGHATLVLEGWEKWLEDALIQENDDEAVRKTFRNHFHYLMKEEQKRGEEVVLVMLEMGRGIVPMDSHYRRVRDLSGWIAQDAANLAREVHYVWHGVSERMK